MPSEPQEETHDDGEELLPQHVEGLQDPEARL